MDETTRRGLDFAAANFEAMKETIESMINRIEANFRILLQEINVLRARSGLPPLPPQTIEALSSLSDPRRKELFELFRSQKPNEVKPWEAL